MTTNNYKAVLEFHRGTRTTHVPSARAGGTNTLVRCPQSGHSYPTSPGSPATGAMVTTSFISVPHFAHRGALSSLRVVNLILDTRPLPQGCSAVSSPPGRSAREHLLYIQGYLAPASEARRSWVMADRNISRVINGVILRGTYSVKDGIVTVTTPIGSKSSQVVRGSKPGSLAYIMLGQLFYNVSSEPCDAPERPQ